MAARLLAVLLTVAGILVIFLYFKVQRGVHLKGGVLGLVLILLPFSLCIVRFPGDAGYFSALLASAVLGTIVLLLDFPQSK